MSSAEYRELKEQLSRIERMLSQLSGTSVEPEPADSVSVEPPPLITPEMSASERVRAVQAEGHYILATQGVTAYQQFWKDQSKKRKPRLKRAA
jgi:hypothetical protein